MHCRSASIKYRIVSPAKGKFSRSSEADLSLLCLLAPLVASFHPSSNLCCCCCCYYYMDVHWDGMNVLATDKPSAHGGRWWQKSRGDLWPTAPTTCGRRTQVNAREMHEKTWGWQKFSKQLKEAGIYRSYRAGVGLFIAQWETLGKTKLSKQPSKCRISVHSGLAAIICFIRSFTFNVTPASPNSVVTVSAEVGCRDVCLVE